MSPEIRQGMTAALGAYVMWGLLPIYLKFMGHLPVVLVAAHRMVWSLPAALALVLVMRRGPALLALISDRRRLPVFVLTAALIASNWSVYLWAVSVDRILEASLGYYLNPLINVAFGVVFLRERLSPMQALGLCLAGTGVMVLALGLGRPPWVALWLAGSFATYSLVRKHLAVDSAAGFALEVAFIAPFALVFLLAFVPSAEVFQFAAVDWALLIGQGVITAAPLILFNVAARRLRLSTIGMLQYLGPTLQFLIGLAYGEAFTWAHAATFALIWAGVLTFSGSAFLADRRARAVLANG